MSLGKQEEHMDASMREEIARLVGGRRFCDQHPKIAVTVMLFIVAVVMAATAASLVVGLAGVLRLLEIRSICDQLLPRIQWWGLLLLAVGLSVITRYVMAYGLILHKRWI
jgi:hypothetical protein